MKAGNRQEEVEMPMPFQVARPSVKSIFTPLAWLFEASRRIMKRPDEHLRVSKLMPAISFDTSAPMSFISSTWNVGRVQALHSFTRWPVSPWSYAVLFAVAELLLTRNLRLGLVFYVVLFGSLLLHRKVSASVPTRQLVTALALVPVARIATLALPYEPIEQFAWLAGLIILVLWIGTKYCDIEPSQLGVTLQRLPYQLIFALGGFGLGVLEYVFAQPTSALPLVSSFGLTFVCFMLLGLALFEELLFRGLLLATTSRAVPSGAVIFVSLIFAATYLGFGFIAAVSAFAVGLLYGVFRLRSGSVAGVGLAHGFANLTGLLIMPSLPAVASESQPLTALIILAISLATTVSIIAFVAVVWPGTFRRAVPTVSPTLHERSPQNNPVLSTVLMNPFLPDTESPLLAQTLPTRLPKRKANTPTRIEQSAHQSKEGPIMQRSPQLSEEMAMKQEIPKSSVRQIDAERPQPRPVDDSADRMTTLIAELQSLTAELKSSYNTQLTAKDNEIEALRERLRTAEKERDELRAYVEDLRQSTAKHLASLKSMSEAFEQLTKSH
jgi:membrane protease YdiL (CAAX protease family)